ncbi:MAG: response regulator [Magnetococcus sp. DMHC-6]
MMKEIILPKRPAILIADDDDFMLMTLSTFLKKNGYGVIEAKEGKSALRLFSKTLPNLVILDVSMPYLDGLLTYQAIRHCQGGAHVPILMVTGLTDDDFIQRIVELGVWDYLTKPIHWSKLKQRIQQLIQYPSVPN